MISPQAARMILTLGPQRALRVMACIRSMNAAAPFVAACQRKALSAGLRVMSSADRRQFESDMIGPRHVS